MKSFVRTLLLLAVVVVLAMGSATAQGQTSVGAIVDSMRHEIIDIAKFIHANPELGNQEFKAVELLTKTLADNGFVIEKGVAGLETAFVATYTNAGGGTAISFMAEYDALEGLGHGCGHNLIAASCTGAAIALAKSLGDTPATVIVFGCPAEETTSGKIPMAAEGLFNRADVGFQMHPGANGIGSYTLALNLMDFTFTGKASHAASAPWEGRSALDGIMMLFNGIEYLREHVKPDVRIHGIVTDGGQAANIVPETALARFYVRSEERSYLDTVVKRVHAIAEAAAIATETQLTITPIKQYDNVVNVPGFMKLVQDVAKDYVGLDMPFATPGGAAASTDFGTASSSIPCVMFGLSPVPEGTVPGHSREMVKAVSSEYGLETAVIASKIMADAGLRIIHNPELLEAIRAEWEVVKAGK
ncbi:MAG: M20 family metallopeptidase [Bacillota bacterium]